MLCAAAIGAPACSSDTGNSPTTPTGIPTVAGTWAGQYHVKTCTDTVNGAPGTLCASVTDATTTTLTGTPAASTQPVQLTITQQGDQVSGTLAFTGWYVQSVPVTGTIGTSGRLWLQGTITVTDPACPTAAGKAAVSAWVTDLNRAQSGMIGGFTLAATRRLSACLFANVAMEADTVDIARKAATTTPTTASSSSGGS